MEKIFEFSQGEFFRDMMQIDGWEEVLQSGCCPVLVSSFAEFCFSRRADQIREFFEVITSNKARLVQEMTDYVSRNISGLEGLTYLLRERRLQWVAGDYGPLEFLRTFHAGKFVVAGFRFLDRPGGHVMAIFTDPDPQSKQLYFFDPNYGIYAGDTNYSFPCQLEYFLLSLYPEINRNSVVFRDVTRDN